MASNDDTRAAAEAAEFKRNLKAMVTTVETVNKKANTARA
jgi:hypothetical protein